MKELIILLALLGAKIEGPTTADVGKGVWLYAVGGDVSKCAWFASGHGLTIFDEGTRLGVGASTPGRVEVILVESTSGRPILTRHNVEIAGPVPNPTPPGPLPPTPPPPQPSPPPLPPLPTGLRVVMISEKQAPLTQGQASAMYSPLVTDWLNSHCVDGKNGWRRWDKDIDVQHEVPVWKQLWTDTKPAIPATLPAILIVKDSVGTIHPFPESVDGMLELLRSQGGP